MVSHEGDNWDCVIGDRKSVEVEVREESIQTREQIVEQTDAPNSFCLARG